jgi:SAM-dependent methyltransferase
MREPPRYDVQEFKQGVRQDWQTAAPGWRKWHHELAAPDAGQRSAAKLVELAEIGRGQAVLDVAGGYGEPSLTAARLVGAEGRVVCTYISPEMLEFGQERAATAGLHNVEFIAKDAEELDFEEGTFDAVVSRAGLMFLPDPEATLRRLYNFLKPGGRLAAMVWGPLPEVGMAAGMPVVAQDLQLPPAPPGQPGIFSLAEDGKLAGMVKAAGFKDVEQSTITVYYGAETPERFVEMMLDVAGGFGNLVNSQPPELQQRLRAKAAEAYSRFMTSDGRVSTPNLGICVKGTK